MNTEKFITVYQNATSKDLEVMEQHLLDGVHSLTSKESEDPESVEQTITELKLEIYYIQTLLYGTTTIMFPRDFQKKIHPAIYNVTQWIYSKDGKVLVSIVGGDSSFHGDGIRTFEMFDFREDEPQGYLLEDEINEHLKNNPFLNTNSNTNQNEN
jgi:hypothetical protein